MRILAIFIVFQFYLSLNPTCAQTCPPAGRDSDLLKSPQGSVQTYIYRITDKEARRIHARTIGKVNKSFLHSLTDSTGLGEDYSDLNLSSGNYLALKVEGNSVIYEYFAVAGYRFEILNNKRDLVIQLFDSTGAVLSDAELKIRHKRIPFDDRINAYRLETTDKDGLLAVSRGGVTTYHNIEKNIRTNGLKRGYHAVFYKSPLKYIYRPVANLVTLPYYAVKSLVSYDDYNPSWRYFVHLGVKFTDIFRSRENKLTRSHEYQPYTGYLVFSKPMYRPGDTLKFKSFVVDSKNGKPVNYEVKVFLQKRWERKNKRIFLGNLSPIKPGSFIYQLPLSDSIKIVLDSDYEIRLCETGKKEVQLVSGEFRYSDYELKRVQYKLSVSSGIHYRGVTQLITVRATDDNGMMVPDCRAEIEVISGAVSKFYANRVFVPDVLWKTPLEIKGGRAEIEIPETVFPEVSMKYYVNAVFFSADNEKTQKDTLVEYKFNPLNLKVESDGDSVRFSCLFTGLRKEVQAEITAYDIGDNELFEKQVILPYALPLNQLCAAYYVDADGMESESLILKDHPALLDFHAWQNNDSVFIRTQNSRKLSFTWYLYAGTRLMDMGYTKNLDTVFVSPGENDYTLSVQYLWAGKPDMLFRSVRVQKNRLNIRVDQPPLVYPGKESNVDILVTDYKGNPVPGVDLTCYGITHKFGTAPPVVPVFPEKYKVLREYNRFVKASEYKNNLTDKTLWKTLDYPFFKRLFGLDTLAYYRFLYPADSIFVSSIPSADGITQVAPFIIRNGEIQPVKVLYIDEIPQYFNWVDQLRPYSFAVSEGRHHFRFVLADKEISVESVKIKPGCKTVFSLSDDPVPPDVSFTPRKNEFTSFEKKLLSNYVFAYRGITKPGYNAYLIQDQKPIPLPSRTGGSFLAGPVKPGMAKFEIPGYLEHAFNLEPLFQYEFLTGVIKMRSKTPDELVFNSNKVTSAIGDYVYTRNTMEADEKALIHQLRRNYSLKETYRNRGGGCSLKTETDPEIIKAKGEPLNALLFRCNVDKYAVQECGNVSDFKFLLPGSYYVMLLFEDDSYLLSDTVEVKSNGVNYLKINNPGVFKKDEKSRAISEAITKSIRNSSDVLNNAKEEYFKSLIENENPYYGPGFKVTGRVVDQDDNTPVPFVNIVVPGAHSGTTSDFDGNFSLIVPAGFNTITLTFVGYHPQMVQVRPGEPIVVKLKSSMMEIQSFEVVEYKVPLISKDRSEVIVTSNAILMESLSAKAAGVVVGGVFSMDGNRISTRGFNPVTDVPQQGSPVPELQMPEFYASLRTNFTDCAYWKPDLTTDANGKATFTVKYPDDITRWDSYVLGMDGHRHSGMAENQVLSYKPLLAQLYMPRFLVAGDTVNALGKVINYTGDSIPVTTLFEVNGKPSPAHRAKCAELLLDSLLVTTENADTLKVKYTLTRDDGYFDGEVRDIPVKPFGIEEARGVFMVLGKDTTFTLPGASENGELHISATADFLDVVKGDLRNLRYYPYLCNEQLASKLKGLLLEKQICAYLEEDFKGDREIRKVISKLEKNQNDESGWGWWEKSRTSPWISQHVIESLLKARSAGYTVSLNERNMIDNLTLGMSVALNDDLIRKLYTLRMIDANIQFEQFISQLEQSPDLTAFQQLQIIELKQLCELPYSLKELMGKHSKTLFGNYFWGNETNNRMVYDNPVTSTLCAYRILERDSLGSQYLPNIVGYLLEARTNTGWRNTYETSQILETLLPSLAAVPAEKRKPSLTLSGPLNLTIDEFPYTATTSDTVSLRIKNQGSIPVYFTAYTRYFETHPAAVDSVFVVSTSLWQDGKNVNILKAGEATILKVTIRVDQPAEYVMIEVPVPAGCSYDDKAGWYPGEEYREQFRDRTSIFCNRLSSGTYTFEIRLLPRYTGSYSLLPAKAELMYFPTFFGRNEDKRVWIK
ncbi:MAG: carboxypeptidase-like regulatory domain-containing protein [Lentimicrobium sp.]